MQTAGRRGKGHWGGGRGGTYKSSAAASLRVVALVIPGPPVGGAAVVARRIARVIVALLRVIHPLPHVVFPSEGRRVGRGGGGRGGGGRRAVALLFRLPARTDDRQKRVERISFDLLGLQTERKRTLISCGASQISQRTSLCSAPGSLPGSGRGPCRQTSCASQYPSAGP